MADLDWKKIGFRCGLEIHQQLATHKLFCACRTDVDLVDDDRPDFVIRRQLRPTQSELGEVDAAALAEARRNKRFEYRGFHACACLVEADEEPPHPANETALETVLTAALLFGSDVVGEIQWMRKIVIDGSNTTGFQRTALVALGGRVDDVGIQSVCLEEDSARRIRDEADRVVWGLDRLGIPLIEVATEPTIRDPGHARQVAARIGALLRSTDRVKRGLGTIRQDLNVSVEGGTRIEVKGVQELASVPRVIEYEVRRQLRLIEVKQELSRRRVTEPDLAWKPKDVTALFPRSESKVIQGAVKGGGIVLGHRLAGFHGLLGAPSKELPRLGRELATYAKREAGLQGLFHGDELPGMGITPGEVDAIRRALECSPPDSFVLIAESRPKAENAMRVVRERAVQALRGVPPEVRGAEPDDATSYLRPMPGAARMYPETDVPPQRIAADRLERLRRDLPPPPETKAADLRSRHGISADEAGQLVAEGLVGEFEALASAGNGPMAARAILNYWPDLERRHPDVRPRLIEWTQAALRAIKGKAFAKEGLPTVLEALASGEASSLDEALRQHALGGVSEADVSARARALVAERKDFVQERGLESVGPLMGVLMKEYRGKVDGGLISKTLRREVERALSAPTAKK